jgi:molybdopterin-guanine dinucleotide biosynthesis protein
MKLQLTTQEQSLLLDAIFSRLRQIDKLVEGFEEPKLIQLYLNDKDMLLELQSKIEHQYETEAI